MICLLIIKFEFEVSTFEIIFLGNFENIPDNVCFMENIRFFNGENDNDKNLSEQIAKAFDVYVMDAFATAHRAAASTLGAIKFSKNACSGLLFSEEIKNLESALKENKQILLISPRGFCAGVTRAIDTVVEVLAKFGPPVYVKHEIVHNKHVIDDLKAKGAIFIEDINDAPIDKPLVFSAHGVAKNIFCLLYTSPSPRDQRGSRMPSSG